MSDQHEEINMGSSIWQSQTVNVPHVSLEFVHHHAGKLRRSLSKERNMFYVIASGACVVGALSAFRALSATGTDAMNVVMGIAALLFSLALIGAAFYVRNNVKAKEIEKESGIVAGLAVYRFELERLIRLTYREWHVLLFFIPSYLTLLVGGLIVDQRPGKVMRYGATIVAGVVSACFAIWVGRKKRQCLQRELDAINSLK